MPCSSTPDGLVAMFSKRSLLNRFGILNEAICTPPPAVTYARLSSQGNQVGIQNIQASKNRLSVFCQQPFEKSQDKTGAFIRARDNRILPNSRKLKIPQQFITHKFSNLTWEYRPEPFRAL